MFPSNNNNGNVPISYITTTDQQILHRPFFSDITPNSKQLDDPSLSFFHFPSPFLHYEFDEEDLILHQQVVPLRADHNTIINTADSSGNDVNPLTNCDQESHNMITKQILRKRSSKRDRHSKINTAQGPRDRRMRLSLEVAREFFDLQDMLGFDKPSKTVQWLLTKSRAAIKELARGNQINYSCSNGAKSAYSSTSECEVVSGIDDAAIKGGNNNISKGKPSSTCVKKEKKIRQPTRKTAAFHPIARDLREKARARARERTREKNMWSRRSDDQSRNQELNLSQLGSWSPLETGEESGTQSHNMNPPYLEVLAEVEDHQPITHDQERVGIQQDMVDESLVTMSPSSIFNYLHNTGIAPQEHQFADFQFFGKPWEAYNN